MSAPAQSRSEFRLGGKALAAALLGVTCGASPLPFNVLPLVMGPIRAEFGWSFASISAGMTIFGIIASVMSPIYGAAADKFGVRPVALSSLLAFGVVFAGFWFLPSSLMGYYLFWFVLGLVSIGSTPVTWSRAISMWFLKNRGLALGIMLLGTSLAGMTVPRIAQAIISEAGWRAAFPALALLPIFLALPVGLAWFREPRPDERPPGVSDANGNLIGLTLGQAVRGYRFWVFCASIAAVAFGYAGAHVHMSQIVQLHGFSAETSAAVMGVVAAGILVSRLVVGFLFDRFWAPGIALPALLLPALACYFLMGSAPSLPTVMIGAFLLGFAAGTESDMIAFLTARYFGMAHYGRIYGVFYMPFGIFSAISPLVYGAVRDSTGNYDTILMASLCLFVISAALLLMLGRYPELATATARSKGAAAPSVA